MKADARPIVPFGNRHLEFYTNDGNVSGQDPRIDDKVLSEFGFVPQSDTGLKVSIPVYELSLTRGRIKNITFSGSVIDTFCIDDMRLVAHERVQWRYKSVVGGTYTSRLSTFTNYPNPLNPTTSIEYDLPKASRMQLAIYNELGRRIKLGFKVQFGPELPIYFTPRMLKSWAN